MRPISRRALLRGAGGAAVALPFLECMRPANAATAVAPKRVLFMYTSSGSVRANWKPPTVGPNPTPSRILTPLAGPDLKPYLTALSGINIDAEGGYSTHTSCMSTLLTASKYSAGSATTGFATGVSIDIALGEKLAAATPFSSLQTGVCTRNPANPGDGFISYRAKAGGGVEPVAGQTDPAVVYARLFSNLSVPTVGGGPTVAPDPAIANRIARDKSVLDFVGAEYKRLASRISTADKNRLEDHATMIRQIETRLGGMGVTGKTGATGTPATPGQMPAGNCAKPTVAPIADTLNTKNFLTVGNAQMDLIAAAFACDQTRVATIQWSNAESSLTWNDVDPGLGFVDEGTSWWHGISHHTGAGGPEAITKIQIWFAERLAYFCRKLKGYNDADGKSVMDNTLVFWCSELSDGPTHSPKSMCFTVMGNLGGTVKSNIHLAYNNKQHGDIYATIGTAMGLQGFDKYGYLSSGILSDWIV